MHPIIHLSCTFFYSYKYIFFFLFFKDENDDDSEESQPVPRNFILNKDPLSYQPHPSPNLSGGHGKQPPPPPPLRTRPSAINSRLKPSDSSFGLHSPDNLPLGFNPQDDQVQVRKCNQFMMQKYSDGILVMYISLT